MNDQAELLERYLTLLRENSQAEPPPELDASLAVFARQMLQTAPASDKQRSRIWQQALESQAHPKGAAPNHDYFEKETHPMQRTLTPKRRNTAVSWTLLGVVATICVIAIWFFIRPPKSNVSSPPVQITLPLLITATSRATETPLGTATLTATWTITPTSTATTTAIPDESGNGTPTLFLITTPVPPLEITPAAFGSANGTITGTLTGENPNITYHFTITSAGVVAVTLSTSNIETMGLQSWVSHANNTGSGGGGGGGGGSVSPLVMQSMGTHLLVLPGDSVNFAVQANTTYAGYTPDESLPYTLDVRYADVVDLGSKAFEGYTDNSLNDFSPLALYKFEANEGDIITIRATGVNGFDTALELYDANMIPPGDTSVVFDENSGSGYDPEIYRLTMSATGTYYVLVRPESLGFGSYRLQLTRENVPSLDNGAQTALFNSPASPQFMFTGHKDQAVTVNVTLPEDAIDYAVENVQIIVLQDGKTLDIFNHDSALQLTKSGIVLSANVMPQSDSPVTVKVYATSKLIRPSQQQFHLEVSIAR